MLPRKEAKDPVDPRAGGIPFPLTLMFCWFTLKVSLVNFQSMGTAALAGSILPAAQNPTRIIPTYPPQRLTGSHSFGKTRCLLGTYDLSGSSRYRANTAQHLELMFQILQTSSPVRSG